MARSKPPGPEPSAESEEGRTASLRSPEKTIGITPSQILEISPGRPVQPRPPQAAGAAQPRQRTPELSWWGGNVLRSEDFAPDAGRKRRRVSWGRVGALVVVGSVAMAGGLAWRSWPKVPFSNAEWPGLPKASSTPPAPPVAPAARTAAPAAPAASALPAHGAPPARPLTASAAKPPPAAPDGARNSPAAVPAPTSSAGSAGVAVAPTEPAAAAKKSHSTKPASKHKRKRHRSKTSRSSKRSHSKVARLTRADDE